MHTHTLHSTHARTHRALRALRCVHCTPLAPRAPRTTCCAHATLRTHRVPRALPLLPARTRCHARHARAPFARTHLHLRALRCAAPPALRAPRAPHARCCTHALHAPGFFGSGWCSLSVLLLVHGLPIAPYMPRLTSLMDGGRATLAPPGMDPPLPLSHPQHAAQHALLLSVLPPGLTLSTLYCCLSLLTLCLLCSYTTLLFLTYTHSALVKPHACTILYSYFMSLPALIMPLFLPAHTYTCNSTAIYAPHSYFS